MRKFLYIFLFALVALVTVLGFRGVTFEKPPLEVFPDMDRQPKYKPQEPSSFWADGRARRKPVEGTVATVPPHLRFYEDPAQLFSGDIYFDTGKADNGEYGNGLPVTVDNELMALGQEKYEIFCRVCHGATGNGKGAASAFAWAAIANLHTPTIVEQPDGQIYETITMGRNTMYAYGDKLTKQERWAVVAYVRALQRSRLATAEDIPPAKRTELGL